MGVVRTGAMNAESVSQNIIVVVGVVSQTDIDVPSMTRNNSCFHPLSSSLLTVIYSIC